jgi:hypothetical protein
VNDPTLFDGAGRPTFDEAAEQRAAELEARRLRDAGIERADRAAHHEWKDHADDAIRYTARNRAAFNADDVWRVLDTWGIPRPREARAFGARRMYRSLILDWGGR